MRVYTDKGTHINVEIQLVNKYNMINRTLFYWSRLYSGQIIFCCITKLNLTNGNKLIFYDWIP
jgi:hypothetical protein